MIRALEVSHRCCFTVYFNFVLDQIDILRLIHHRPQCECHRDLDPRGTCIMPCSTSEVVILVVMVRLSSLFDEFFQGNRWPTCTVKSTMGTQPTAVETISIMELHCRMRHIAPAGTSGQVCLAVRVGVQPDRPDR